jgi:hypothetical protein
MAARKEAKRPALPAKPAILVSMKSQNVTRHTFAHRRLHRAHLHPSLRQGGRQVLAAPAFGTAANQRTFKDDLRPGRPIERAVRFASVPSQLGGSTVRRLAFLRHRGKMLHRTRSIVATAQDGGRFESSALPPSQTPQFSAASPNRRVLSAHSFRPRPPTSPGSGREERAAASGSTSQAESSEISSGTP